MSALSANRVIRDAYVNLSVGTVGIFVYYVRSHGLSLDVG